MDIFVARQAVFDHNLMVDGYELLFRSCYDNRYDAPNGSLATSSVLANSLFSIGLERILSGKRGFINFDRELLLNECAFVLPANGVVIEILETVEPEPDIIAACRRLRQRGYSVALDDFVCEEKFEALTALADIIKIDFQSTSRAEQKRLVGLYRPLGIKLLAEKIETLEEFEWAREVGYSLFQGYFTSRPVVVRGRNIPGIKAAYLRLIEEAGAPELNLLRVENLIKQDVSLTYNLLRYINSAAFAIRAQVESVKHAILLMGEERLRKWIALAAIPAMSEDKPRDLISTAMIRARFCEILAGRVGFPTEPAFLTGMFSRLDAMLDRPLGNLLRDLNLPLAISEVLLGRAPEGSPLRLVLQIVRSYEMARWDELKCDAAALRVAPETVTEMYLQAVQWADGVMTAT